jgi:hypothetical protein
MGDIKHPGIQNALKNAQKSLDGFGQAASKKGNIAATKFPHMPRDQREAYQDAMNEYQFDLINAVAEMVAYAAGAVDSLKDAVDLIAKEMPSPRRTPH